MNKNQFELFCFHPVPSSLAAIIEGTLFFADQTCIELQAYYSKHSTHVCDTKIVSMERLVGFGAFRCQKWSSSSIVTNIYTQHIHKTIVV